MTDWGERAAMAVLRAEKAREWKKDRVGKETHLRSRKEKTLGWLDRRYQS